MGSVVAQDSSSSRDLAAVKRVFRKLEKPEDLLAQREEALSAIKNLDSGEAVEVLVEAYVNLEQESAPIVAKRHRILLSDSGERLQALREDFRPQHRLQEGILDHLTRLKSEDALSAFQRMLAQKRLPLRLRIVGARAAATLMDAAKTKPRATRRLPDLLLVLEAARSMERAGQSFAPLAIAALERPEALARERAIQTLAATCAPESIQPLIDFLDSQAEHRLKAEAARALCVLTEQNLGTSSMSWRAWLTKEGQGYLDGSKRLGNGKPDVTSKSDTGYYFGIPLDRSSIVFVHDNSLSMNQKLGERTRLQRSVEELEKALDALAPTQRFNIVLLANRVWSFESGQVAATPKNVARAKDWLRYQPVELGTAIYNALEAAFLLAGRGVQDRYYEAEVDTIFLLSDGAPTPFITQRRGAAPRSTETTDEILRAVDRWNTFDRVQIHTVLLGAAPRGNARANGPRGNNAAKFMQDLAKQNNGRFENVAR